MSHDSRDEEHQQMIDEQADLDARKLFGAPTGARQNVRNEAEPGGVGRPGGATQNSGGAIVSNDEEHGAEPGHSPVLR